MEMSKNELNVVVVFIQIKVSDTFRSFSRLQGNTLRSSKTDVSL